MEEQYLTFQKFSDQAMATELAELLKTNNIVYIIENTSGFDTTFINSEANKEYRVKLKKEDFEKANTLLLQITMKQLDNVEKDYYLFDFTDEELIEIVTRSDEWGQFDYLLAQRLLKERSKEINPELAETLRKQRIKELAKPEESQMTWIYAGYAMAIVGGLLSVFIGWHLMTHKKTLPTGDRVYGYSASDRKHGNRIFLLGIIFFVIWVVGRAIVSSND